MGFIGNQPALSYTSFAVQHFTTSATTSYTLNYPVANENEIRLVINNVVQQPGSSYAYSASGTSLTLSAATSATDTMYAVFLGKAVQTVNPPNGSVGLSQLSATGTKDSTTFLRGDNTFAVAGGNNTPSFSATNNTTLSLSNATDTLMTFQTENFDTDNAYDNTAGNYKFTVPSGKAGKYYFTACVYFYNTTVNNSILEALIFFKKNGTNVKYNVFRPAQSGSSGSTCHATSTVISTVLDLAVGDYVQCYVSLWVSSGNPTVTSNTVNNYFEGFKLL